MPDALSGVIIEDELGNDKNDHVKKNIPSDISSAVCQWYYFLLNTTLALSVFLCF